MSINTAAFPDTKISEMAEHLTGSEIIKLAQEISEKIKSGSKISNLTIGDFDPKIFPVPALLLQEIINAYKAGHTNYPAANGMAELRKAVCKFLLDTQQLAYTPDEVLIAGGARPLIYGIYKTLIDPGDKVIFPVPSWNNNHYCHLTDAQGIAVETSIENNFMPSADDLREHLHDARMIALCSPLNPTGTVFSKDQLKEICLLVIEENKRRENREKPLYVMYDQIYSRLVYGDNKHHDPVSLFPEMKDYTLYVDGISKSFAATGLRVGWAFGPAYIIDKMKSVLSHVGAWAPKAEQIATAAFLTDMQATTDFLSNFKQQISKLLNAFYKGFMDLKEEGFSVNAIVPQAAIYLTVQFDLTGKKFKNSMMRTQKEVSSYLIDEAKLALVPFSAFGALEDSSWYRLSVGTCTLHEVEIIMANLKKALAALN